MEWLENMNRALNFLEDNLQGRTDYGKIACMARCSVYHFQRMFTFMTDITLSEYIRRRKMTLAAFELQSSDIKIVDLALKYGYESPEAFSRAFQKLHGLAPTAVRGKGADIKAFPRISFQIQVKGVSEMNYKIVERPAFQVYGLEGVFDMKDDENLKTVPEFWRVNRENGKFTELLRSAGYPSSVNAVCGYRELPGTEFVYMMCVVKTPLSDTAGYTVADVPASTWAIFTNEPHEFEETPQKTQELIARVYTEWLPTANYEMIDGYDFEMYYTDKEGRFYEEVWFRVRRKKE